MMWHEQEAKRVLENWLDKFDRLMLFAELATSRVNNRFNREGANKYRQTALKCKTLGLVYHDRFKMCTDVFRRFTNETFTFEKDW